MIKRTHPSGPAYRAGNASSLGKARRLMAEALVILDSASTSAAPAMLDLAIHTLDHEIRA